MPNFEKPTGPTEAREGEVETITTREKFASLACELAESQESFSFPGISPESYNKLKRDEEGFPDFAGFATTPVDVLIEKLQEEGMRVVIGANPQDIFLVPTHCLDSDIDGNTVKLRALNTTEDPRINALIIAEKNWDSLT